VFWEEVQVQIGFATSKQVQIVGSNKVLDFSDLRIMLYPGEKSTNIENPIQNEESGLGRGMGSLKGRSLGKTKDLETGA